MEVHDRKGPKSSPPIQVTKVSDERSENSSFVSQTTENRLGFSYWISIFILAFFIFNFAVSIQTSCDIKEELFNIVKERNKDNFEPIFNDTMARLHLKSISRLGRRPAGSIANEIHAPSYIMKYLDEIKVLGKKCVSQNLIMEVDDQVAELNSFPIVMFGKYHVTSVYNKIRNIVVRLHDTNFDSPRREQLAILFNCHYDSFFDGPGASDDLVSCAVLLEIIRSIMISQPVALEYDLIFLFNGAEENMLQASHAFVTQHKWSKYVRLFVNLEAAGSGGRQMIFQTSARNPWLIQLASSVMRQPLANVIGQEIFSANLIPSDTDFRIFRDFAALPGIDIAFITNGYVYHTRHDTDDRISQRCLIHTGDNMLQLALKLANSPQIKTIHPEDSSEIPLTTSSSGDIQRIVYFDFLGLLLISYSENIGIIINLTICSLSILLITLTNREHFALFKGTIIHLLWFLISVLFAFFLGFLSHQFGNRMSWYSNRYHIVGLYLLPLFWLMITYYSYIINKKFLLSTSSFNCARILHSSSILLLVLLTIFLTVSHYLSSYFLSIWLLFIIIHFSLKLLLLKNNFNNINLNYFLLDSLIYCLPLMYYFYMLFILYDFFIPIMGRLGMIWTDIIISCMTAIASLIPIIVILSPAVCLTSKRNKKWLLFILLNVTISYWLFVHCTDYGFPYNSSNLNPRKQRLVFNHVTRNIRNNRGQIDISESGIWIASLDANGVGLLKNHLQKVFRKPMQEVFCELRPYCGYPLLFPFARIVDGSMWLPGQPHSLSITRNTPPIKTSISSKRENIFNYREGPSIIVLSQVTHMSGMVNLTIQLRGPPHAHLYIMTPATMRLLSWSLGPYPPKPIFMDSNEHPDYLHYFIYSAYGSRPSNLGLVVWITFMPRATVCPRSRARDVDCIAHASDRQIELAMGAFYTLADTPELETILHLIPRWITPAAMASTYEHIVVDFDQHVNYKE